MPAADLEFALVEFKERTKQIREIMVVVESAGRTPTALTTNRAGIDLGQVSVSTGNTAPLRQTSCRLPFHADDPRRSDNKCKRSNIPQSSLSRH